MKRMTLLDLFAGIGGFSLAGHRLGWETSAFVEWDERCKKVLKKNFPNIPIHEDIRKFDGKKYRGTVDVVSAGDPCQPHSFAGMGKGEKDDRFLWPEAFRVIREVQPPWVVNENVPGSIPNGVLDLKIDDLESESYTCQAYCLPAEAVGALHQRERVWLVAYNADFNRDRNKPNGLRGKKEAQWSLEKEQYEIHQFGQPVDLWDVCSHPDAERFKEQHMPSESGIFHKGLSRYFGFGPNPYGHIPGDIIESGIMGMLNGLPEGMDYADRGKRIAECGNSIVPQVAYEIFRAIETSHP